MEDEQTSVETSVEKPTVDKPVVEPVDKPAEKSITETLVEKPVETTPPTTSMGLGSENVPLQEKTKGKTSIDSPIHGNEEAPADTTKSDNNKALALADTTKQYAYVNPDTGTCVSCNDIDVLETTFKCMFCSEHFHAVCKDAGKNKTGKDVICTRSFWTQWCLATGDGIYSNRPGNFHFVCNICETSLEVSSVATQDKKIDKIDRRVDSLTKSINQIKEVLTNPVKAPDSAQDNNIIINFDSRLDKLSKSVENIMNFLETKLKPAELKTAEDVNIPPKPLQSYASTAATPQRSVIVIENNNNSPELTLHPVIADSGARVVTSSISKKDGSSVVVCRTKEDRNNFEIKLKEKYPLVKTHHPPELMPTISVANLTRKYSFDDLEAALLTDSDIKNLAGNGGFLKVISVRAHKKDASRYQASVRVSGNIRDLISKLGDRVYFNSSSYPVFDHFHVKRCNRCQKFNHYEIACKGSPICGLCSESHISAECPHTRKNNFYPTCSNCKNNHKPAYMHTHNAFSTTCPCYLAEQNKLRGTVNYNYSQNQKN
jgi:CO dehydrogenase/acetyl-CoA synthase epsilon subunit